jgi:hypothetical protein
MDTKWYVSVSTSDVTLVDVFFMQRQGEGSMDVMSAIDFIDAHMLPFFSTEASTGKPNEI